jgi:hypothetical protein
MQQEKMNEFICNALEKELPTIMQSIEKAHLNVRDTLSLEDLYWFDLLMLVNLVGFMAHHILMSINVSQHERFNIFKNDIVPNMIENIKYRMTEKQPALH